MSYDRLCRDLLARQPTLGSISLSEAELVLYLAELLQTGAHHWTHDTGRSADYLIRHYGLGGYPQESVETIAATEKRHPHTIRTALRSALNTLGRAVARHAGSLVGPLSAPRSPYPDCGGLRDAAQSALASLARLPPQALTPDITQAIKRLAAHCQPPLQE